MDEESESSDSSLSEDLKALVKGTSKLGIVDVFFWTPYMPHAMSVYSQVYARRAHFDPIDRHPYLHRTTAMELWSLAACKRKVCYCHLLAHGSAVLQLVGVLRPKASECVRACSNLSSSRRCQLTWRLPSAHCQVTPASPWEPPAFPLAGPLTVPAGIPVRRESDSSEDLIRTPEQPDWQPGCTPRFGMSPAASPRPPVKEPFRSDTPVMVQQATDAPAADAAPAPESAPKGTRKKKVIKKKKRKIPPDLPFAGSSPLPEPVRVDVPDDVQQTLNDARNAILAVMKSPSGLSPSDGPAPTSAEVGKGNAEPALSPAPANAATPTPPADTGTGPIDQRTTAASLVPHCSWANVLNHACSPSTPSHPLPVGCPTSTAQLAGCSTIT
eukprot:gene3604-4043_t